MNVFFLSCLFNGIVSFSLQISTVWSLTKAVRIENLPLLPWIIIWQPIIQCPSDSFPWAFLRKSAVVRKTFCSRGILHKFQLATNCTRYNITTSATSSPGDVLHLHFVSYVRTHEVACAPFTAYHVPTLTLSVLNPEYVGIWSSGHWTTCDVINLHVSQPFRLHSDGANRKKHAPFLVQNRCINRPTHLELINVPFSGFTDDFVQTSPARRKDVESKKERG